MNPVPLRPLALGKLSSPRLGRVFDRARLFAQLDAAADAPGLWLAAPPGAGKTTLVATWLRRAKTPLLWLRLDADDADPATFARSFDALLASLASEPVDLPAFGADELLDLSGWLRRRLRRLLPLMPQRWALVLDNLHELPASSGLHAALAGALAELPAAVQWIFVSRDTPPPAWAHMLAGQQLVVFGADALRLDEAETKALVRLHGHAESMAAALAAAQGWAAGMTLMLLSTSAGAPAPAELARERLFGYFAGEVLADFSAAEQRTLGLLSHLPGTTAELAVAMSGDAAAASLLERLAAASLFTDRLDASPTVYVFHALFGDFLRWRFEQSVGADEALAVRRRAAALLLAAGDVDAGLQRLIDAGAWDEALAALRAAAPRHVAEGRVLALGRHLARLPPEVADQLAYWRGVCQADIDPAAALRDMTQAHRACAEAGDSIGQIEAAAGVASSLLALGRLNELGPWIGVFSEHAWLLRQPGDPQIELRVVPALFAALTHHMPWHPMAEPLAERAEALLHADGEGGAQSERLLLGALTLHWLWRGQLERLERIVGRVDALCREDLSAPATRMRWWNVGILVKSLLGDVVSARADAAAAVALADEEPALASQRAGAALLAGIAAVAARDVAALRHHLDQAAAALRPERAIDRAFYEHQRAMLALFEGDGATALQLMPGGVASGRASGFAVREHIALICHALVAAVNGQHELAVQLLQQVRSHPIYPLCRWHHWIGGCVAAFAALERSDPVDAKGQLRMAFAVARECGFRSSPMLYAHPPLMPALVALALDQGIEVDVARDIVVRNGIEPPADAPATWPWPVQISVLGALAVRVHGASLASSRKESRRLLELLRLLAAMGAQPLEIDRVADELWPDAEGDAARNALDNALHRLRKLLGGDDRVLLRRGTLLLNPARCWIDVTALERQLDRLDGASGAALVASVQALPDLYRGPLLPDEELPTVTQRRRQLQQRMQRVVRAACERLEREGQGAVARAAREQLAALLA